MPKINQEEYKILREIRKDGFEEIRRNSTGDIAVRSIDEKVTSHQYQTEHNDKFKFMEATGDYWSIAELIEEYGENQANEIINRQFESLYGESEETEVKNIEWLKKWLYEYEDEIVSWLGDKHTGDYFSTRLHGGLSAIKEIREKINQLDEPEVLSEEWIDKHKVDYHNWIPAVPIDYLQNLLVPKQELPVIPKFVADWVEKAKRYHSISWLLNYENIKGWSHELTLWCFESGNDDNLHKLARAWLDGYTVEEEQKYYVKDEKGNILLKKVTKGFGIDDRKGDVVNSSNVGEVSDFRLTEQEIKGYDPRYWAFAKPVEELEE